MSKYPAEARTLAPAGTMAVLVALRSTAGSCFGRFIGLLLFVKNQRSVAGYSTEQRGPVITTISPRCRQADLVLLRSGPRNHKDSPWRRPTPTRMSSSHGPLQVVASVFSSALSSSTKCRKLRPQGNAQLGAPRGADKELTLRSQPGQRGRQCLLEPANPTRNYRKLSASGAATLATPPSTSQKLEGPTLAPTGTEAYFIELRSTAGNCFGRFMVHLLSIVVIQGKAGCRSGSPPSRGLECTQKTLSDRDERTPVERRTYAPGSGRHRGRLGGVAINCGNLLRPFHLMLLHHHGCGIAWPAGSSWSATCGSQTCRHHRAVTASHRPMKSHSVETSRSQLSPPRDQLCEPRPLADLADSDRRNITHIHGQTVFSQSLAQAIVRIEEPHDDVPTIGFWTA